MANKKEQAKQKIGALIEKYQAIPEKRRKAFNEAEVCKDFILPMFAALGWDTTDSDEVAAEVRVNRNYADYGFKLERVTRFFTEAKAPKVDLDNQEFAKQAVDYAWNKMVAWAVLTNFAKLSLFNAEWEKKNVFDLRVLTLEYTDYLDRFDDLWALSRDQVKNDGIRKAFQRYGGAVREARSVNIALSELMRQWRVKLLSMFQHYNSDRGYLLGQLDEAVQRVLDRLIFIRTLEDRFIEDSILADILRQSQRTGSARRTGGDAWVALQAKFR